MFSMCFKRFKRFLGFSLVFPWCSWIFIDLPRFWVIPGPNWVGNGWFLALVAFSAALLAGLYLPEHRVERIGDERDKLLASRQSSRV